MDLTAHLHTFGHYLKRRHGEAVHKLSLAGDFTCPNRDGTLGRGGCTFCNVKSFGRDAAALSISGRLPAKRTKPTARAVIWPTFRPTPAPMPKSAACASCMTKPRPAPMWWACAWAPGRTACRTAHWNCWRPIRPGKEVWLELGLQTAHDHTQRRILRGHTLADYRDAVRRAQQHGLKVCTHLIAGLPGEDAADVHATLDTVLEIGVQG
jgi:radical SAM superfamily enzyme